MKGAWTDATFTVPLEYSTRIRRCNNLPPAAEAYILELFKYFNTARLFASQRGMVNRSYVDELNKWYASHLQAAQSAERA